MIKTAKKDKQVISEDWHLLKETIQGVHIKEVLHVPRDHGVITEVFRPEWDPTSMPVVQVYQSRLFPGAIGAWSCHTRTVDRLFVTQGHLKAVLYDGREESPTYGMINELLLGDARPAFVVPLLGSRPPPLNTWHALAPVFPLPLQLQKSRTHPPPLPPPTKPTPKKYKRANPLRPPPP